MDYRKDYELGADGLAEALSGCAKEIDTAVASRREQGGRSGCLTGYTVEQLETASLICRLAGDMENMCTNLCLLAVAGLSGIQEYAVHVAAEYGEDMGTEGPIADALCALVRYLRTEGCAAATGTDCAFFATKRRTLGIEEAYRTAAEGRGAQDAGHLYELCLILNETGHKREALRIRLMLEEIEQDEDCTDYINTGTLKLGVLDGGLEGMEYGTCLLDAWYDEPCVFLCLYRNPKDKIAESKRLTVTAEMFFDMKPEALCREISSMMQYLVMLRDPSPVIK